MPRYREKKIEGTELRVMSDDIYLRMFEVPGASVLCVKDIKKA
ncbi:hypothetical protein ACFL6O_05020 [candidate division KSB1 bacterium]